MKAQKAVEVFFKIVLLLVLPTPKNLREFFGYVNKLFGGSEPTQRTFSANQWDEIRRARDEAEKREALKAASKPKAKPKAK